MYRINVARVECHFLFEEVHLGDFLYQLGGILQQKVDRFDWQDLTFNFNISQLNLLKLLFGQLSDKSAHLFIYMNTLYIEY